MNMNMNMNIYITTKSLLITNEGTIFGRADLTRPKCNNHLLSFIKVEGLFVSYIVTITWYRLSRSKIFAIVSYLRRYLRGYLRTFVHCNNHLLVSFIKFEGLFVPYIVDIFGFLVQES